MSLPRWRKLSRRTTMRLPGLWTGRDGAPRLQRIELAFALRVTVAAALALLLAQALGLALPLWSVLTAVVVNQLSVGRTLGTGIRYLLGTIGGCVVGGAV